MKKPGSLCTACIYVYVTTQDIIKLAFNFFYILNCVLKNGYNVTEAQSMDGLICKQFNTSFYHIYAPVYLKRSISVRMQLSEQPQKYYWLEIYKNIFSFYNMPLSFKPLTNPSASSSDALIFLNHTLWTVFIWKNVSKYYVFLAVILQALRLGCGRNWSLAGKYKRKYF